jgi:hypothetical protein
MNVIKLVLKINTKIKLTELVYQALVIYKYRDFIMIKDYKSAINAIKNARIAQVHLLLNAKNVP